MDNKKNLEEKLRRKKRQTLVKEERDLQDRQEHLRNRKEHLIEQREALRADLYDAMKSEDEASEALILKQLSDVTSDISEINSEYKTNSECLECYAKVTKSKSEGRSSVVSTIFGGIATAATVYLGVDSLRKAYKSDEEGTLVNKKTLDVFNRINPLKLLSRDKR